jgi:acyl-lipid omega-6 desaturase (Delta-12 desaturase)
VLGWQKLKPLRSKLREFDHQLTDKTLPAATPNWTARLAEYRVPDNRRASVEIIITALPFALAWGAMWLLLQVSYWLVLIAAVPTAGLLVRMFMIQHDCGHGSLFSNRRVNDWTGRIIGILTFTPYDQWRLSHALHHASTGNLDRRGIGDIDTLTVAEYLKLGRWGRLRYRLYRHPLVMFGLGPAYLFLLQNRLPDSGLKHSNMPWFSTLSTNGAILVVTVLMILLVGIKAFLMIQLPLILLAASAGVWLFYVQHQFERTYWEHQGSWNHDEAALQGSSYYDLPPPLMWFTGNIGVHHLHHLSSRIPFFRLGKVLRKYPELKQVGRLTLLESLRCVRLTLWDETQKRLISFRQMRQITRQYA